MTRPRLGKLTDELAMQIRNYLSVGIKRVLLATNLNPRAAAKLSQSLMKKLPELAGEESRLEVVPGTPDALLARLDKIAEELAKELGETFAKKFATGTRRAVPSPPALPPVPVELARRATRPS